MISTRVRPKGGVVVCLVECISSRSRSALHVHAHVHVHAPARQVRDRMLLVELLDVDEVREPLKWNYPAMPTLMPMLAHMPPTDARAHAHAHTHAHARANTSGYSTTASHIGALRHPTSVPCASYRRARCPK